ncbi:MAG: DUF4159 domain-containing protein [Phycisphaerae bacterium]|nr:DUF4159 domain-containing protein [Phycisphaerae bacterium]
MSQWTRVIVAALVACIALPSGAQAFKNPKAEKPPEQKPQFMTGGESLVPLPLPGTTLRRTEKKHPPAPPALVGMINFSVTGQNREAFPTTQIDIERLMKFANEQLDIHYRYVATSLNDFSYDPNELSVLYLTGWTPMPRLNDDAIEKLRRYLYDGGTLVLHAQCGRKEFTDTAREAIARILPNRPLTLLDSDSFIYHAYYKIDRMRVRTGTEDFKVTPPLMEAVYLGCRPAIIFSPIDLNCGWDVEKYPIAGGVLYHQDDGMKLGVNILTSALANFQYAQSWGTEKVYHEQEKQGRDELVIAQIVHNGDWDPTPHALPNLMKYVSKNTTLNVMFKREVVDLSNADVFKHPVLYMTGLRDFKFTPEQVELLKKYFRSGGVLVADAAAGSYAFDQAFRRELARVIGEGKLKLIEMDNAVYQNPYQIRRVSYSKLARAQDPRLDTPRLEGVTVDGQLQIIYSPHSLSNGWEQLNFAYNRGYGDEDALRLGVNIFSYVMTH